MNGDVEIAIRFEGPLRFQHGAGLDRTPLTGSATQIAEDLRTVADVKPRIRG